MWSVVLVPAGSVEKGKERGGGGGRDGSQGEGVQIRIGIILFCKFIILFVNTNNDIKIHQFIVNLLVQLLTFKKKTKLEVYLPNCF